jgi:glycosyltransferase involved in cell wall biosynthesis|tara:strand:+ start:97 stop:1020 length:924 start_codon:yes stop_codon:yes gene_type:complete
MKITVLIPYFNEFSTILKTLDNLNNQTLKANQVILIDSGSTDSTSKLINNWIEDNNKRDVYLNLFSGKMNPSTSLNYGLENAKYELIAYIDCGLKIPLNWLETGLKLIKKSHADIVSKCIYTEGKNMIDKSFIAQTYGHKQKRPCLPGSLIDKKVFKNIGNFLENVRSGYDTDFINRIEKNNLVRLIDYAHPLEYYGYNFSPNIFSAFKKIFSYSLAGWKTKGDNKPFIYFFIIVIFLVCISNGYLVHFLIFYIIGRGYIIPYIKSAQNNLFINVYFMIFLPISGLIVDVARFSGYLFSLLTLRILR